MQQAIGRCQSGGFLVKSFGPGFFMIFLDFFSPTPWLISKEQDEQAIQCMTHDRGRSAKRAMQMGQGRVQQSTAMASKKISSIKHQGRHHGTLPWKFCKA